MRSAEWEIEVSGQRERVNNENPKERRKDNEETEGS